MRKLLFTVTEKNFIRIYSKAVDFLSIFRRWSNCKFDILYVPVLVFK